MGAFDFGEVVERVTIDLTNAHLWDRGAVEIIDRIVLKFRLDPTLSSGGLRPAIRSIRVL